MANKRKRQEATNSTTYPAPSSTITTTSEDLKEMIKQAVEEASARIVERQEQICQEIHSKLDDLSDQVNSIKIGMDNLSSMTAPVANTTTTARPNIPKPRMKSGEKKSSFIFQMFKDNIVGITDDEATKLVQYLNEAAKDACKVFAIATGKEKTKYLDLTGTDRQKLFKLVGEEARERDERCSVADRCSGLWAYELAAQPKWSSKSKNSRKKEYV